VTSFAVFWACKRTIGLRVSAQEEIEGLDIHEHGMWGYPEQFTPGYGEYTPYIPAPTRRAPAPRTTSSPAPATGD
jgi:Amt family ammonium transporter